VGMADQPSVVTAVGGTSDYEPSLQELRLALLGACAEAGGEEAVSEAPSVDEVVAAMRLLLTPERRFLCEHLGVAGKLRRGEVAMLDRWLATGEELDKRSEALVEVLGKVATWLVSSSGR